jgi:hypothetical protein
VPFIPWLSISRRHHLARRPGASDHGAWVGEAAADVQCRVPTTEAADGQARWRDKPRFTDQLGFAADLSGGALPEPSAP